MRWSVLLLAAFFAMPVPRADAQSSPAAETLFAEGRRLMDEGRIAEGCAKLEESVHLERAGGTLMNLALCYGKAGRTASAWSTFRAALAQAQRDGKTERVAEASSRLTELEERLARIRIVAPSAPKSAEALTVSVDGVAFGSSSWGVAIPFDPGPHHIEARAPGRESVVVDLTLGDGEQKSVDFSALTPGAAPKHDEPSPPLPRSSRFTPSVFIAGAVGVVGLGLGTYFGVRAADAHSTSGCGASGCPNAAASDLNDQARARAWASDAAFLVGALGIGIATYLIVSGGRGTRDSR